jgi:ribosome-binding factor A
MRIRPERVAQMMRREISAILGRLRDPRLHTMVSVTDVEVTKDLSSAKVYVSLLETGEARDQVLQALGRATGFVRHELAGVLDLREMPEIHFKLDTSIEHGARVDELLRKLEQGEIIPDDDEPDTKA